MVATQKLYPRSTVKRVVKAHSNRSVSKNADILVSFAVFHRLYAIHIRVLTVSIPNGRESDISGLHVVHARVSPTRDLDPLSQLSPPPVPLRFEEKWC